MRHMTLIKADTTNNILTPVSKGYYSLLTPKLVWRMNYKILWYSIKNNQKISNIKDLKIIGDFSDKKSKVYTLFLEAGVYNIDFNELYTMYGSKYNEKKLRHLWFFGRNNIENYIDYIIKPGISIIFYEGRGSITPIFITHDKIMRVSSIKSLFNIIGKHIDPEKTTTPLYNIIQLGRRYIISTVNYNIFTTPSPDDAQTFIIWDYDYDNDKYFVNGLYNTGNKKSSLVELKDVINEIRTRSGVMYEIKSSESFPVFDKIVMRTHAKMGIADKVVEIPVNKIKREISGNKEYYYIKYSFKKVYLSGFEHVVGSTYYGNPHAITLSILKGLSFNNNVESINSTLHNMLVKDVSHTKTLFSISKNL